MENINEKEYQEFLESHEKGHYAQSLEWVKVKSDWKNEIIIIRDEKGKIKRKEKLQKIAEEACKQCGRMDMVDVADIVTWDKMCEKLCENDAVLFAYESSHISLKEKLNDIKDKEYTNIGIIIGAEGGFTPKEAQKLESIDNVACISLGSRILRAETAALNLLSIVLYEMEG